MKDDTGAALQHARQKTPIKPYRRHQVDVQCPLPVVVRMRLEPAIGSVRSAEVVHQDIDATPMLEKAVDNRLNAICHTNIPLDQQRWLLTLQVVSINRKRVLSSHQ